MNLEPNKKKLIVCLVIFIATAIMDVVLTINSGKSLNKLIIGILSFGFPAFIISYIIYSIIEGRK